MQEIVRLALQEDLAGIGDLTSRFFVAEEARGRAQIISKEQSEIVLAGTEVASEVFRQVDDTLSVNFFRADGETISNRENFCEIEGNLRSILTAERTVLNFLQRLSGVATLTRQFVDAANSKTKIIDTRKTTPAWRSLEKQAVLAGGGHNHRMGLYDAILVKDNHLQASAEALQEKIDQVRKSYPDIMIEFEADTLEQVEKFLSLKGLDRILLDNMSLIELSKAVQLNSGKLELEASGGVTLDTVEEISDTGVDFISVGALTHSYLAVDLSLEITQVP